MRSMSLLLLAATLGACSTGPQPGRNTQAQAHLDKVLSGKVAQKSIDCLPNYRPGDMVVIDDSTILFHQGSKIYRNNLNGGACNGIGSGNYALVTNQYDRLCRGDISKVVDLTNGVMVGSCVMGDFIPYVSSHS